MADDIHIISHPLYGDDPGGSSEFTAISALPWLLGTPVRPTSSSYQYAACNQAGTLGSISGRPFTLSTYKAEDSGCLFRAGRPPGAVDPGGGGGAPTPLRPPTGLRPGLVHSITSSHDAACGQAGAFGPIADRPFNPLNVRDDGNGEDSTGSRFTGSYNNWHRESGFAGGGEGVRSGLTRLSSGNTNTTYTSGNAWARWSAHNTPSSSGRFVFGRILIDRRVFNGTMSRLAGTSR
jgi:hypothetical protein